MGIVVAIDSRRCKACWNCVEACPKGVLGKVSVLFHKHAKVTYPDSCIGCFRCVKACQYGAINKLARA